ncbi:MAG TPA: hypothetical protein VGH28_30710 [Polyangiaceae bacterium]|jgi:hypothetical protein
MKVRALSTILALSLAVPLAIAERPARAQVSDADRNAARDLYNEGWSLQQGGRYADALERYQRSLAVFPAPTTAFRIAQCKAALGKLVEAAEEYRAILNAPLPAGAPPAFATARNDAGVELGKLEPRIPKIQINVAPAGLQGLVVQVDNVNMPTALVGVPRPVDPGSHTITASAPGYAQAQAQVDVRERQSPMPQITLTLQPGGGGVAYSPNGGTPPPYQGGNTYPNGGYPPNGGYSGTSGYSPYNTWVPPRHHDEGPRNAFMIGVDGALSVPFGSPAGTDLTSLLGVGGGGGVDVGVRLARVLYLGALAQLTGFNNTNKNGGNGINFALDGVLGLMSNPEGVGIYGEIGVGFRYMSVNVPTSSASFSMTTLDVVLGLGFQVKGGPFRVIPKIDLYLGPNDGSNGAHGAFTLGIAGFWEMPFGPRPAPQQPANVPATPATTTTPAE